MLMSARGRKPSLHLVLIWTDPPTADQASCQPGGRCFISPDVSLPETGDTAGVQISYLAED